MSCSFSRNALAAGGIIDMISTTVTWPCSLSPPPPLNVSVVASAQGGGEWVGGENGERSVAAGQKMSKIKQESEL